MAAIRTEELDVLMPEFLPMTIKFAAAFRAGYPKDFGHDCSYQIRNPNG
jgi:hypothetical protein